MLIRADWTKPNHTIEAFLNSQNRFGIPFNAFYSKNYQKGIILSELLSEKEVEKIYKINARTLQRERNLGIGIPYVKIGDYDIILNHDIENFDIYSIDLNNSIERIC